MNISLLRLFTAVCILFITINSVGQNNTQKKSNEDKIERILLKSENSAEDESITVDELVDNLSVLLDINRVSREQLTQLFILSPYQIESLINYRLKNGGFHSIYEIQLINGFDKKTIDKLLPYISVDNMKENFVPIKKNTRIKNELSLRYDIPLYKREGDYNSFIGPSFYTALRYNCQLKDKIEFGLVAEKDSGEPIFGLDNSCGFDYYSYYLIIKNINKFDKIFIGKFRVNYGLGLTVGTRNFGGKWNEIQSFFKDANGVSKHSSVDEYNYFRGIACIYKSGNLEITPFISHKETGGTIKENKINSIYTSGLYRTAKEIEKKNAVKQVSMGSRIAYHFSNFTLGVNGLYYYFNLPIGRSTKNYAKYDIVGNNFFNIGTDYTWYWNKVISKGELAISKSGIAVLNKIYYAPTTDWDLLFIYRYYSPRYWGFYSNAFGSQSKVKNENGYYISIQTKKFYPVEFNAYIDYSTNPWWKYRLSKASYVVDMGAEVDIPFLNHHSFNFRFSYKQFERDRTGTKGKIIDGYYLFKSRIEYHVVCNDFIELKSLGDCNWLKSLYSDIGYHLTQRVSINSPWLYLKTDFQYTYFNSPSFDTRLYIYEKGLLYNSYIPSFYGRGHRLSLNINNKPIKNITLMIKYGLTFYADRSEIGSGVNKINKRSKADLQLMGRIKF